MQILCLGLSHHTASVELRERLNYSPPALEAALARFSCGCHAQPKGISELAILSTCNRLELYACVPAPGTNGAGATEALFAPLLDFIVETRGMPVEAFDAHLYRYAGPPAVQHLCRVAAGLDSLILGEPQILGQVTEAYEAALGKGAAGSVLSALFRTAIRAGKRARTETAISRNPASVSSVAIRLAAQTVGDLTGSRVLVVGAGEMGVLAAEALRARGVRKIGVANRTRQRAADLATGWRGQAYSFEQLPEAIAEADIVIAATGAPHIVISSALVQEALARRAERPLVFIDIAVPRDVDPAVSAIPGVRVFDVDDLQSRLDGAVAKRRREIPHVEAIATQEAAVFEDWLRELEIQPLIADLRKKAEAIRQRELDRTLRHLHGLDPEAQAHIQHLSCSLVNKLLHEPTLRLRQAAANGHAAEYAAAVRHLFDLSPTLTQPHAREEQA